MRGSSLIRWGKREEEGILEGRDYRRTWGIGGHVLRRAWQRLSGELPAEYAGSAEKTGSEKSKAAGFGRGSGVADGDVGEDEGVVVVVKVRYVCRQVFHAYKGTVDGSNT